MCANLKSPCMDSSSLLKLVLRSSLSPWKKNGYIQDQVDNTLFTKCPHDGKIFILMIYVDDCSYPGWCSWNCKSERENSFQH